MFTFEATNDKPLNPGDVAELLTRLAQDSAPHSERYVGEVTP